VFSSWKVIHREQPVPQYASKTYSKAPDKCRFLHIFDSFHFEENALKEKEKYVIEGRRKM